MCPQPEHESPHVPLKIVSPASHALLPLSILPFDPSCFFVYDQARPCKKVGGIENAAAVPGATDDAGG